MKINNKIKNYYLNYSKNISWKKKPKKSVTFDFKENRHQWFQDGILSPYENLIDNNIKKNLKNKTAIITVSKNKLIQEFSYSEIDARVNKLINHFFNGYKKKKLKVMIQASASIESAILMLACSKLGIHFSFIFEVSS